MKIIRTIKHLPFDRYNEQMVKTFLLDHPTAKIFMIRKDAQDFDNENRTYLFYHQKKISPKEVIRMVDIDNDVNLFKEKHVHFKN